MTDFETEKQAQIPKGYLTRESPPKPMLLMTDINTDTEKFLWTSSKKT